MLSKRTGVIETGERTGYIESVYMEGYQQVIQTIHKHIFFCLVDLSRCPLLNYLSAMYLFIFSV